MLPLRSLDSIRPRAQLLPRLCDGIWADRRGAVFHGVAVIGQHGGDLCRSCKPIFQLPADC